MDIPHGTQLMNALFGGMTEASTETSALEKRLEFDLRRNGREVAITPHLLRQVAESLNVVPFKVESGDAGECALLCDKAVVVATASQLIITCDGDVKLHQAVNSVRELVEGSGYQVEWASFLRKNTSCPWDTRDATIAHEYAALKATFPSGKPFVFGPVDSDHYFYFVYDGIQRGTGTQESDVQLNIKLYNVEESDSFEVNDKSPLSVRFRAPQSYETLRWQRTNQGNVVSFESNGFIAASLASMKTKIDATRPERFTIMVLLDPHCDEATAARDHLPLGFEPNNFEGYSLLNRTTNTFEHGYLVIKLSYTCH